MKNIKTDLFYNGIPGGISPRIQYWEETCPECNQQVRIPLHDGLIDWESAYTQLKYEMGAVIHKQQEELKKMQANRVEPQVMPKIADLEDRLFTMGVMLEPPCFCCGYNGKGYFQPENHPCAERHHKLYRGF